MHHLAKAHHDYPPSTVDGCTNNAQLHYYEPKNYFGQRPILWSIARGLHSNYEVFYCAITTFPTNTPTTTFPFFSVYCGLLVRLLPWSWTMKLGSHCADGKSVDWGSILSFPWSRDNRFPLRDGQFCCHHPEGGTCSMMRQSAPPSPLSGIRASSMVKGPGLTLFCPGLHSFGE